jgi:hypothetical protein
MKEKRENFARAPSFKNRPTSLEDPHIAPQIV